VLHEELDQWNIYKYGPNGKRDLIHESVVDYFEGLKDLINKSL
jgi:hypothetical protein